MKLAAFDIASRTGICLIDGERIEHVETWKTRQKRPEGLGPQEIDIQHEAAIGEEFRAHVFALLASWNPEHIGYEQPRTRDYERTKKHVGLGVSYTTKERGSSNLALVRSLMLCGHLIGVCNLKNIGAVGISLDDWRKSFLGYSRAPRGTPDGRKYLKQATIAQCKLIGVEVPNDDAADSVGVGWALRGILGLRRHGLPGELFSKDAA